MSFNLLKWQNQTLNKTKSKIIKLEKKADQNCNTDPIASL